MRQEAKRVFKISIGIPVYNESENIADLLASLFSQEDFDFYEIIFILSACHDDSEERIKKHMSSRQSRYRLLKQPRREGKASAINLFLKEAAGDMLILINSDIVLDKHCLGKLISAFDDTSVGMVGVHPIPRVNTRNQFVYAMNRIIWDLHHHLALKRPKLGEVVAFVNRIDKIPQDTAVDEVHIEMLIKKMGYTLCYRDDAFVYNRCPTQINDLFMQRVRIFWGHVATREKFGYKAATMDYGLISDALRAHLSKKFYLFPHVVVLCFMEIAARTVAVTQFYFNRKASFFVWRGYKK